MNLRHAVRIARRLSASSFGNPACAEAIGEELPDLENRIDAVGGNLDLDRLVEHPAIF